jgi:DDE superfamily endonuclease
MAAVEHLAKDLLGFYRHFRACFKSRTHHGGCHAWRYWRGQLTMEDQHNFANIERRVKPGSDGQKLQHFMSDSPWSSQAVYELIQKDIKAEPALQGGGLLILDESGDKKAGQASVGAARQWNGRQGKIDICQVAACLAFAHPASGLWTMVDAELFLPEQWFDSSHKELREKLGIPAERVFQTKPELGLGMIRRAIQRGLPFQRVAGDDLYGRNRAFRAGLGQLLYALDVPSNTPVTLSPRAKKRFPVVDLAVRHKTRWRRVQVRSVERGLLVADFTVERVWTPNQADQLEALWLVIRRDLDGKRSFTLLNDPPDAAPEGLIEASCQRHFVECVFEEAKSELGWDDFCAQKYLAWEHHTALTAAALWFVAGVKLEWRQKYQRDPQLNKVFNLEVLPALSTANVRELLQAILPLPRLGAKQARDLVVKHLICRSRSTRSRLKKQLENSS